MVDVGWCMGSRVNPLPHPSRLLPLFLFSLHSLSNALTLGRVLVGPQLRFGPGSRTTGAGRGGGEGAGGGGGLALWVVDGCVRLFVKFL